MTFASGICTSLENTIQERYGGMDLRLALVERERDFDTSSDTIGERSCAGRWRAFACPVSAGMGDETSSRRAAYFDQPCPDRSLYRHASGIRRRALSAK